MNYWNAAALLCAGGFGLLSPAVALAAEEPVAPVPHRLVLEAGAFFPLKSSQNGGALGLGYQNRVGANVDLGLRLRYYRAPEQALDYYVPRPVGSTEPLRRAVAEGFSLWSATATMRFFSFMAGRWELGLGMQGGVIGGEAGAAAIVSVAPDIRFHITERTALYLAPEFLLVMVRGEEDRGFGVASAWLGFVRSL